MVNVRIEQLDCSTTAEGPVEIVERKGVGHPDSICDGIMEYAAVRLAGEYRRQLGRVVHFNLDKGLLAAGSAERSFGSGKLLEPMRLIFGDRATFEWQGQTVPVFEIIRQAADDWFGQYLPRVNPRRDLVYQSELRSGSPELSLTALGPIGAAPANDTSAAVGYAPLTPTEQLVLAAEGYLNGAKFKRDFRDTGEDVKVMAFRIEQHLRLTVAMPFLAAETTSEEQYFRRKEEASRALMAYLDTLPYRPASFDLELNSLDIPGNGAAGTYLSVIGTSAEDGDSGEVGRGNRVNGLISLNRPASAEAAAGKNPISHVGKLYNVLCFQLAQRICDQVDGVREVYVWLGSQIGEPVNEPPMAAVQLILEPGYQLAALQDKAREIVRDGLANLGHLAEGLIDGTVRIY
ncbi:MAG TPA: methionine adenosyltransferase [Chloroflexota bacterium]|nr:methionine adenosyltransferase [Chloroflexota bacterium]